MNSESQDRPERPRRGDVVKWKDHYYFFQPNGTSCFLYRYQEEIGAPERARGRPARNRVVKASPRATEAYRRFHLRVPNQIIPRAINLPRPNTSGKGKEEVK